MNKIMIGLIIILTMPLQANVPDNIYLKQSLELKIEQLTQTMLVLTRIIQSADNKYGNLLERIEILEEYNEI